MRALLAVATVLAVAGCSATPRPAAGGRPAEKRLRAEVLDARPHDPGAFTEGLELHDGVLYEGTGLEGRSSIRATDPETGAVRKRVSLEANLFGEGITVVGDTIWQLTWRDGVAIRRDRATLAERGRRTYAGEGWGLCHDGRRLVMSDGTNRLTFRDPETFAATGHVDVRDAGGRPVKELNELECAGGAVYANVWRTDQIVRIDPATGRVDATVDLAGLLPPKVREHTDVLNGIAAIPGTDEFLVTGKLWPTTFRVRFVADGP